MHRAKTTTDLLARARRVLELIDRQHVGGSLTSSSSSPMAAVMMSRSTNRASSSSGREREQLSALLARFDVLQATIDSDDAMLDVELRDEFAREHEQCAAALERQSDESLFGLGCTTRRRSASCYVEVHAGAGGVDSMDWCAMMARMYARWAARTERRAQVVDETHGDIAGLKSCVVRVDGRGAFARLRREHGVHRLVRLSPFDAAQRCAFRPPARLRETRL